VTGASSGIGVELARAFARRGLDLVLTARSAPALAKVAQGLAADHGVRAETVVQDLGATDGPAALAAAVAATGLTVDVLVNNAGFGIYGPFGNQGPEREAAMVRLNVSAPTETAARFLPGMVERGRGLILNVASTAAFAPVPWLGTYAATKAYLLSWTHALDEELRGTGVRAAVLCPGTTESDFHAVSGSAEKQERHLPRQTARDVADEMLRGLDRRKRVIVSGALNRLHAGLAAALPAAFSARMGTGVMRPKRDAADESR
jgi:short-subunit dehydrogenase